jgi:tetratricopeptide (TPR) repeat protein
MHHALTARLLNELGALLYQSGRYNEAAAAFQQALPIDRDVYGPEHPEVATVLNNIARSDLMAGHVDEAEPLFRQALAMSQKFQGDNFDGLVPLLNSLAMIDAYRGRTESARSEIQRADSIARMPDQGELLDQVLLNEADIELASGNRTRAAALFAESKALLQKTHPESPADAWRYAVWDAANAQLLAANGDSENAAKALSAAQAVIIRRFGANGFYNLLAIRRALLIANQRRRLVEARP